MCEIAEISNLKLPMADKEKLYYTLKLLYRRDSTVYAPVENRKIIMRPVITKEKAEELVKIIKILYVRKQQRLESGKKVIVVDEKYFHQAEDKLYAELAYALGIDKQKVGEYIVSSIQ